jgi:lysophospholipase L1-like esterase
VAGARESYLFDFGSGPAAPGYPKVTPETVYTKVRGYGFDLGCEATVSAHRGYCASARPFFFSVDAAEGNYDVTVTLGDAEGQSAATVMAESRRLMLEDTRTKIGEIVSRSFTVNVRNGRLLPLPENAPGGTDVALSDKERAGLNWDEKLTLEFRGGRPCVRALEIRKTDSAVTVYLAGDSTVTDQPEEPYASWGQMLPRFFAPGIAIANHAHDGETLKSFVTGLRLAKILDRMKAGDYLFIQFGHNDMKEDRPQTYVEPFTTYAAYLKVFIAEARRRGAYPVLVTSVHRRHFDAEGRIVNTLGRYPEAMRMLAVEKDVPLIDLNLMSGTLYEALGPEKAPLAFANGGKDLTHHNSYGAYLLARCVVEGIGAHVPGLAGKLLRDAPPFDPSRPEPDGLFRQY